MARTTKGVLAIWHDIEEARQEDVLNWYNKEHHIERVGIAGFVSARRYASIEGAPQVFVFYRTISPNVLISKEYLERVNNPTSWTQESMPYFRNNSRTVCHKVIQSGIGDGCIAATIRFTPPPGVKQDTNFPLNESHLTKVVAQKGMCSAELWQADLDRTHIHTKEREIRSLPDDVVSWVAMISGTRLDVVKQQAEYLRTNIEANGAEARSTELGLYRLDFALDASIIS